MFRGFQTLPVLTSFRRSPAVNQQAYQAVDRPEVFEFARPCPCGEPMSAPLTTGQATGPRARTDRGRTGGRAVNPTDEGVSTSSPEEGAESPVDMDAEQFAWAIRRLAVDAHGALQRPDAPDGELLELRRRSEVLLRAARGSRQAEIRRWLRSAHRALDETRRPARHL
jgi:hypothetical protein